MIRQEILNVLLPHGYMLSLSWCWIDLYNYWDGSTVLLLLGQHSDKLRGSRFLRPRGPSDGLDCGSETDGKVRWHSCWIIRGLVLGTLARPHHFALRNQVEQNLYTTIHSRSNCDHKQTFISAGDYLTCRPRYGANELFANNLYVNNNLFQANLNSLV